MSVWLWLIPAVLVLALWQRRSVKRLLAVLSAQFNKAVGMVWRADPLALFQAEIDQAAEEIGDARQGLEQYRGLVTRYQRKVAGGEKEVNRLTARVKNYLAAGNEDRAADEAMHLKKAEDELTSDRAKLADYEGAYNNNLRKVKFAHKRIEDAREKAQHLGGELKLSRLEAETSQLAEKFSVKTGSLDGLGEIEDEIQKQIDGNRSKAQVAQDLASEGLAEIEEQEALQKQEAKDVLNRLKNEMGMR